MIVPSNFNKLLEPGLRKIWGDTYTLYPEQYSKVFNVESTSRAWEEDQQIVGGGLTPEKPIGRGIEYLQMYQGFTKRYSMLTYGKGFIVARELLEDDLYRKIAQLPKEHAKDNIRTVEILSANILNRAFNSSFVGGDGVALCSASHPIIGGTFTNLLPTADLDITSFEEALLMIAALVDGAGMKVMVKPRQLVIHPSNEFMAQYILKSERLPDTVNNNYNPAKGLIPYTVMNYLTDDDAWFIQTDISNGLNFFWRRRPEFSTENDFDTENARFKTTFRCDVSWTDPRCVVGSAGA